MSREEHRRIWLSLEALVGESAIELDAIDDGAQALAPHEPSDVALADLAATVPADEVAMMRSQFDKTVAAEWNRRRALATLPIKPRATVPSPDTSVAELLAIRAALIAAHPGLSHHHRDLVDDQAPDILRAQIEDMQRLIAAGEADDGEE